jgi:uncharacterized phiE125 gp8 family phage protein
MSSGNDNVAIIPEVPTAIRILSNGPIYFGTVVRNSQPSNEPVALTTAKTHCRIDVTNTDEDALITLMMKAARKFCEGILRRAIVASTFTLTLDLIPNYNQEIVLPYPPLISLDTATIHLKTGDQTLDPDVDFDVDLENGKVKLNREWYNHSPDLTPDLLKGFGAFELNYTAGMAVDGRNPDVDETIQLAILMIVGHWYDHRDSITENRWMTEVPQGAMALLQQNRIFF